MKTAARLLVLSCILAVVPAHAVPPFKVQRVRPEYPRQALRDRLEGMVVVQVDVKQDGSVADMKVLAATPPAVFDDAVREAVMKWHFLPLCSAHFARPFSTKGSLRFGMAKDGHLGESPVFKVEDESYVGPSTGRAIANPDGTASIQASDPCTGRSLEAGSPVPVGPEPAAPESMPQDPASPVRERPSPAL